MYSSSLLVLALAVFGASAQTLISSGLNGCGAGFGGFSGGFSGISGGFSGISGCNTGCASTPVIENVPLRLPSIIHPTSVQDSCNCIKTVVRPTVRKEVYNIPSVQRFVQTTSTPVVETVPYVTGSSVELPAVSTGVETGLIGNGLVSGVNSGFGVSGGLLSGVNSGCGITGGLISGVNTGCGITGGLISGVNSGCGITGGLISGVNTGCGITGGLVSGVNSGCGLNTVVSGCGCNY